MSATGFPQDLGLDPAELTFDKFLGGALTLAQPGDGFRSGSDAVLLASAIRARAGETLLDIGAGVGVAGYCALHRLPECQLWGVELQKGLAELARFNAEKNGFAGRVTMIHADIADRNSFRAHPGPDGKPFLEAGFHHVFTNPPFYAKGRAQDAKTETKTLAHIEGSVTLPEWLKFCIARARSKGTVSVIHRADYLADILAAMSSGCGDIRVIPLWPKRDMSAKRVLVQGTKGIKGPLTLTKGLILHEKNGELTSAAERISRYGAGLEEVM